MALSSRSEDLRIVLIRSSLMLNSRSIVGHGMCMITQQQLGAVMTKGRGCRSYRGAVSHQGQIFRDDLTSTTSDLGVELSLLLFIAHLTPSINMSGT